MLESNGKIKTGSIILNDVELKDPKETKILFKDIHRHDRKLNKEARTEANALFDRKEKKSAAFFEKRIAKLEKEKKLNLAIAKKLQKILEKKGYRIVLTRDSNKGLYHRTARNKKVEDMKKRCEIINKEKPVFTISIHQNSYPEEYVKGAQVFYYGESQEGKELAEVLQKSLVAELDKENHRTAKANESYYLLKKTKTPTVIVECGFLSNRQEAELLSDAEYQQKVAVAISKGIENYLNEEAKDGKKP